MWGPAGERDRPDLALRFQRGLYKAQMLILSPSNNFLVVFTLFLLVFNVHFFFYSFIKMLKTNSEDSNFHIILPVNFSHFYQSKLCKILIYLSPVRPSNLLNYPLNFTYY